MNKNIVLCADDFGLASGVSRGILQLVRKQRLSAVSCMVGFPAFGHYASELLECKNQTQTGLHFNLTEGYWVSEPDRPCFTLKNLIIRSHLRLINPSLIEQELHAQLDRYVQIMGALPDFIDGHQHVHQFPQISSVLFKVYEQRLKGNGIWIRSTYPAITLPQYRIKTAILQSIGGKRFYSQLQEQHIAHNETFTGVYDFAPDSDYRTLFRQWLRLSPAQSLIMCHPGEGTDADDCIASARAIELNYLAGEDFLADCYEYGISLASATRPES